MVRKVEGLLLECTKCKKMLPRGRFGNISRGKLGKHSWCKECRKPGRAAAAANRRKKVRGSYKGDDIRHLYIVQKGRCVKCARHLGITGYHVDHIIPISKGGLNVAWNLQLLCPRCNLRKGAK